MTPLSGLDALYLHPETPETPIHVGSAHLLPCPTASALTSTPSCKTARTETSWRSSLSATPKPKSPARRVQPRSAWGARAIEAAK